MLLKGINEEEDLGNRCVLSVMNCVNQVRESDLFDTKPNGIVKRIVEDDRFEYFIQFFIFVNSIALGSTFYMQPQSLTDV